MKSTFILMFFLLYTFKGWALTYQVITPKQVRVDPTLITLLHGCTQTINQIKGLTHLEKYVEEKNIILLMPAQNYLRNPIKCWNWFLSDESELKDIKDLIIHTAKTFKTQKSFLYGFSAGAAMTSSLVALHSNLFDGVLIHSGFPHQGLKTYQTEEIDFHSLFYQTDFQTFSSHLSASQGKSVELLQSFIGPLDSRLKNIMVVSGIKDRIAAHKYAKLTFLQFTSQQAQLMAHANDHYNVFISDDLKTKVYLYEFPQMGHAWSGGDERFFFASPDTQDITEESFKIFGLN